MKINYPQETTIQIKGLFWIKLTCSQKSCSSGRSLPPQTEQAHSVHRLSGLSLHRGQVGPFSSCLPDSISAASSGQSCLMDSISLSLVVGRDWEVNKMIWLYTSAAICKKLKTLVITAANMGKKPSWLKYKSHCEILRKSLKMVGGTNLTFLSFWRFQY